MGHFCAPGFGYGSTDLIESGSKPDPKHCSKCHGSGTLLVTDLLKTSNVVPFFAQAKTIRRRLPQDGSQGPISFPESVAASLGQAATSLGLTIKGRRPNLPIKQQVTSTRVADPHHLQCGSGSSFSLTCGSGSSFSL